MSNAYCVLNSLSFTYPQQSLPLFSDLSITLSTGWTGIVGPNGSGKSTLAHLLAGHLSPTRGSLQAPPIVHYCAQEVHALPPELFDLMASPDGEDYLLLQAFGVEYDWPYRWESLSFGERKRAQIAAALFVHPDMLLLDEPTNHLDARATRQLAEALRSYAGIGVIISHDRDLLDRLCEHCLFFESGGPRMRSGGVTAGLREAENEAETARREHAKAAAEVDRLRRETVARRTEADRADSRRSKRGIARHDHDAKGKIDLARVTGKDGEAGRRYRRISSRLTTAQGRLEAAQQPPRLRMGVTIEGKASRRDRFFLIDSTAVELSPGMRLLLPRLSMTPKERILLMGPNGSGKSTLLRWLLPKLQGTPYRFLPQELTPEATSALSARLAELDHHQRGEVLSTVSRLGSSAERLIESADLSPGEARKLWLALSLLTQPELLIMDEPTNHLDLPSILCVEEALAGSTAAQLIVSHDRRFAERLATRRWTIIEGAPEGSENRLRDEPLAQ